MPRVYEAASSELSGSPEEFLSAARRGDVRVVRACLRSARTDPNRTNFFHDTAVNLASQKGHHAVMQVLLADERVDPTIVNRHGHSPLHVAANEGHHRVMKLLLSDKRVDPTLGDGFQFTAMTYATFYGHDAVVRLLLADNRVDPNLEGDFGTALMIAAGRGHDAVLQSLLTDERTIRERPLEDDPRARAAFDAALRAVKQVRNARFKGVVRGIVVLKRMRLRAALAVYAPGGAGFAAAAASFSNVVAELNG